jgi:diaminohydroxyphosphoribosylaminopyrimidine deaminase/5-amino-6-(5-phosphoribosylamino)uracil reductase
MSDSKEERSLADRDVEFMQEAVELGLRGKSTTAPNPNVGCVIVKDQKIIGRGYHQKAGQAHAEVCAINNVLELYQEAGERMLEGATAYVTLEPCAHTGRTGPCDQQLIKYKFARVVVGVTDPDERVSGRGLENLRKAGIEVVVNICLEKCQDSMKHYLKHRTTGLPWVIVKTAQSLNGQMAPIEEKQVWITKQPAIDDVHKRWRGSSQAIIIGTKTAKIDNPKLNVRLYENFIDLSLTTKPLRVVVGRNVILGAHLLDASLGETLVCTNNGFEIPELWLQNHVKVVGFDLNEQDHVPLEKVLRYLGECGVLQVLIESGPNWTNHLLSTGLVDQFVVYQSCTILNPSKMISWGGNESTFPILTPKTPKLIGNDVCFEFDCHYPLPK